MKTNRILLAAALFLALAFALPGVAGSLLKKKLESMVIPELKFRDASIDEVIQYIRDQSRALDPDGAGVNIILMTPGVDTTKPRLTMSTTKTSVKRALDLTAATADLNYYLDGNTVIFKNPRKAGSSKPSGSKK